MRGVREKLALSSDGYWPTQMVYCSAVYRKAVHYGPRGLIRKVLWSGSECMKS